MYLKKLENKKVNMSNYLLISADFETIIVSNIHYVYAYGYMYENNNGKAVYFKEFLDLTDLTVDNISLKSKELIKSFLDNLMLLNHKKPIIYFHNLGSFDGIFILDVIDEYYYKEKIKLIIKDNNIYKITLNNLTFLDSLNIATGSLDDISKIFFKESKFDFNINTIKEITDLKKHIVDILLYLHKDVKLLYNIVKKLWYIFNNDYNIDIVKYFTLSSIGYAYYRKNYYEDKTLYALTNYRYEIIRRAYFGGVCELYNTTAEKGYLYDINSLYPWVMKTFPMPIGKSQVLFNCSVNDIKKLFGFIYCLIYVPEDSVVPLLPYRDREGTILQSVGYLEGTWFSEEIKFAIDNGAVLLDIYKVISYDQKKILFDGYINELNKKKIESTNSTERFLYKKLMNSLYGRFGLKKKISLSEWVDEEDDFLYEASMYIINKYGNNERFINYKLDEGLYKFTTNFYKDDKIKVEKIKNIYTKASIRGEHTFYGVDIAAAISSYARIRIKQDIINHIKNKNAIVYYVDTDSIHTNIPLDEYQIDQYELGKYKLVKKFIKGSYIAPKTYITVGKDENPQITFKNVSSKENINLNYEILDKCLYKNNILKIDKIDRLFNKDMKNFRIFKRTQQFNFAMETKKYIKVYNKENKFVKTKYIYIKRKKN